LTATGPATESQPVAIESRLEHMPLPLFAIVMGMAGTAIVYLRAEHILWNSQNIGVFLTAVTAGLFVVLAIAYGLKTVKYPNAVRKEFDSPVRLHFFPTISISLILMAVAFLHLAPTLALVLWAVGSAAHLLLTLKILSIWIQKEHFAIDHIEPSWFIPVVGNILVPVAGVELAHTDISWFFFSIGLIFWILLFTIFLYRIIFHSPLAIKRLPTFFILIAPPAVAFISYVRLTGEVDSFARVMYFFALFLFILLVFQWRMFRSAEFFISWWAYSFPIAALTVATVLMSTYSDAGWIVPLAWTFVVLLTALIAGLLALTVRAALRREICRPD
jgi:tellurite resistance protein